MKFSIKIADAKNALEAASVVLNTNTQIQEVLKNYMIQADENGVLFLGTDLEIAMLARQKSTVESSGSVLVDGKKLSDIIRYASGETLDFEIVNDKLEIRSATGKSSLLTRTSEEYPKVDDFDNSHPFSTINRQQFIQSLEKVTFAVCEDETRRALNAIQIKDNQFVSTDGKMVAVFTNPVKFDLPEVLIPQRSITPLLRVLKKFDAEEIKFQEARAFYYFKIGENSFSIRKVTVQFPLEKVKEIINKAKDNNKIKVEFNRTSLISAIERVRLNASADTHALYLGITNGKTTLKSQDGFGNYSVEQIPSTLVGDEEVSQVDIFFNWLNLMDVLKAMSGDKVSVQFAKKYQKSAMYLGEQNLDAVLLPIESSFDYQALK
jgi:DNA polymerase-3 subunit beta